MRMVFQMRGRFLSTYHNHFNPAQAQRQTQIVIETPYRNDSLFADMLQACRPSTRICVAADITLPDAFIRTRTVAEWKKENLIIGKRPCVFLILA